MIKYLLITLILISPSIADEQEDDILKILNRTAKHRISSYPDYQIYDPFKRAIPAIKRAKKVEVKATSSTEPSSLKAIINRSAYIDGVWLNLGETIRGYKLVKVATDYVVLQFGDKNITLSLIDREPKGSKSIKIIEMRDKKRRHRKRLIKWSKRRYE